jgi:hypothetical protein
VPVNGDDPKPPSHAAAPKRRQAAPAGYYRGFVARLSVVVFALAVAWLAPVQWRLKLVVYLVIMLIAVVAVILFRASKRARRISN